MLWLRHGWIGVVGMPSWEPKELPNLTPDNHTETSPKTIAYNCIGWALGEQRYYWPIGGQWPKNVPRDETLDTFVMAFESRGYELCEDASLEEGFEKVALYLNDAGEPMHAARQLEDGKWTSKLGEADDIIHSTLDALICRDYGCPQWFLKRRRA